VSHSSLIYLVYVQEWKLTFLSKLAIK
ncbi:hypothetical protein SOVF_189770, partial [Spinacia oleracea]